MSTNHCLFHRSQITAANCSLRYIDVSSPISGGLTKSSSFNGTQDKITTNCMIDLMHFTHGFTFSEYSMCITQGYFQPMDLCLANEQSI